MRLVAETATQRLFSPPGLQTQRQRVSERDQSVQAKSEAKNKSQQGRHGRQSQFAPRQTQGPNCESDQVDRAGRLCNRDQSSASYLEVLGTLSLHKSAV